MLQLLLLLIPIVQDLIGRIPPAPQAQATGAAEMQTKLIDVLSASDAAQLQADAAEAANPSMFVSDWRPFVGWLCAIGLGVQAIAYRPARWARSAYCPAHACRRWTRTRC